MSRSRVELQIDELVLHGFPAGQRHAVAEALRVELERLLSEPEAAERFGDERSLDRLRLGQVPVRPGARPEAVGASVARKLFAALGDAPAGPAGEGGAVSGSSEGDR